MEFCDICIIGGGVIGNAIARELARYQHSIILLEKANDVAMGSSKANSGILHGGYDSTHGTLKSKLEKKGNDMMRQWDKELHFGIDPCGSLVLAFTDDDIRTLDTLKLNGKKNGVHDLSIISSEAVQEYEPHINKKIKAALYCPHSGVISPYELTIALAENAVSNGVRYFLNTPVHNIYPLSRNSTQYRWCIESPSLTFHARYVINCAGVYADEIAKLVGTTRYQITPRKGSYYVFQRGYLPINHVLFQPPSSQGKGVLVSPTYHGNMIIGPNAIPATHKDDTKPDKESLQYIETKARLTLPSLNLQKAIRSYAGIRPSSVTKDFIIQMDLPNFINLVGIDSPGLTSAPAIAEYVCALLDNVGYPLHLRTDYHCNRRALISRQKDRKFISMYEASQLANLPEGNPQRIICRCEQVYETTILDALKRSPIGQSIDSIKRRTRASMGICQGKFCRPRIRSLLAKHWDIDPTKIEE